MAMRLNGINSGWQRWHRLVLGVVSMLTLSWVLTACGGGGGGGAQPRFTWDAATSVLRDSVTGLSWQSIPQGSALTAAQRLPTVDELLLLTDKATLSDIPTAFSATLLNNENVFALDYNLSTTGSQTSPLYPEGRASVWAVSFVSDDRGALYGVRPLEPIEDATAKQPVIVTASSTAPYVRSRLSSNYGPTTTRGVVYDIQNDLTWKMCSEPVAASGLRCGTGTPQKYTLAELTQFLATNRTDGWRLPTKYELQGLLDRTRGFEAQTPGYMINTDYFDSGTVSDTWWSITVTDYSRGYWTSTQAANSTQKFIVSFDDGSVRLSTPTIPGVSGDSYYVRLVRSGKF